MSCKQRVSDMAKRSQQHTGVPSNNLTSSNRGNNKPQDNETTEETILRLFIAVRTNNEQLWANVWQLFKDLFWVREITKQLIEEGTSPLSEDGYYACETALMTLAKNIFPLIPKIWPGNNNSYIWPENPKGELKPVITRAELDPLRLKVFITRAKETSTSTAKNLNQINNHLGLLRYYQEIPQSRYDAYSRVNQLLFREVYSHVGKISGELEGQAG